MPSGRKGQWCALEVGRNIRRRAIEDNAGVDRLDVTIALGGIELVVGAISVVDQRLKVLLGGRQLPTQLGKQLSDYFNYRADVLNRIVEPCLMDAEEARLRAEMLLAPRAEDNPASLRAEGEAGRPPEAAAAPAHDRDFAL